MSHLFRPLQRLSLLGSSRDIATRAFAIGAPEGQTVFGSAFGGDEVVIVLERDKDGQGPEYDYKRMATAKKTSTLEKELRDAGLGCRFGSASFDV